MSPNLWCLDNLDIPHLPPLPNKPRLVEGIQRDEFLDQRRGQGLHLQIRGFADSVDQVETETALSADFPVDSLKNIPKNMNLILIGGFDHGNINDYSYTVYIIIHLIYLIEAFFGHWRHRRTRP